MFGRRSPPQVDHTGWVAVDLGPWPLEMLGSLLAEISGDSRGPAVTQVATELIVLSSTALPPTACG